MISISPPATALLSAAALSILLAGPASAGLVCLQERYRASTPYGPIPFVNRGGALKAAKARWEYRVAQGEKDTFAVWDRSASKKIACNRTPNGFGGYNWHCDVSAKPCRYE